MAVYWYIQSANSKQKLFRGLFISDFNLPIDNKSLINLMNTFDLECLKPNLFSVFKSSLHRYYFNKQERSWRLLKLGFLIIIV